MTTTTNTNDNTITAKTRLSSEQAGVLAGMFGALDDFLEECIWPLVPDAVITAVTLEQVPTASDDLERAFDYRSVFARLGRLELPDSRVVLAHVCEDPEDAGYVHRQLIISELGEGDDPETSFGTILGAVEHPEALLGSCIMLRHWLDAIATTALTGTTLIGLSGQR